MLEIENMLQSGFEPEEILGIISKKLPELRKKISAALMEGYLPNQVLDFLKSGKVKNKRVQNLIKSSSPAEAEGERLAYQSELRPKDNIQRRLKSVIGDVAPLATGAIAPIVLSRALPTVAQKIIPVINQSKTAKNIRPQTAQNLINDKVPDDFPLNVFSPQIVDELTQQKLQPNVRPSHNLEESTRIEPEIQVDVIEKLGLGNKIKELVIAGNGPEQIEGYLKKFAPKEFANLEKTGKPGEIIADYVSKLPKEKLNAQTIQAPTPDQPKQVQTLEDQNSSEIAKTFEGPESLQPKKMAMLPGNKIGQIESVKNGVAKVNIDGQIRHRKLEDLIESPEDAATQALELIKSFTPEQQRSAHHAMSFYDDQDKKMYTVFHDGKAYVIENISPEEYERISTEVEAAKTSGNSKLGAWAAGEGSRGAAYNNIVKKLNKPYRRLQVGYDFFQNFRKAINEAEKKEKRKNKHTGL